MYQDELKDIFKIKVFLGNNTYRNKISFDYHRATDGHNEPNLCDQ